MPLPLQRFFSIGTVSWSMGQGREKRGKELKVFSDLFKLISELLFIVCPRSRVRVRPLPLPREELLVVGAVVIEMSQGSHELGLLGP